MRMIALALLLSACSDYPRIDWPAGAQPLTPPRLLPQAEFMTAPAATDPGASLVSRADALRAWAATLPPA